MNINNQTILSDGSTPTLKQVQVRIGAGNDWTSLPDLASGMNVATVDGPENAPVGIFRSVFPDGNRYVGNFAISGNTAQFTLSAHQTEHEQYVLLSSTASTVLLQVPKNSNSWSSLCTGYVTLFGAVNCWIYSSPTLLLAIPSAGAFILPTAGGTLTSEATTPQQLLDAPGFWVEGGCPFVYVRITIHDIHNSHIDMGGVATPPGGFHSIHNTRYILSKLNIPTPP